MITRRGARIGSVIAALALCSPLAGRGAAAPDGKLGAVVAPVRLVPVGSEPLRVTGLGSYLGGLRVGSMDDGLVLVNRLSLEDYLLGINEVPSGWPQEALRAQAIAARTYALWTLERERAGAAAVYGFDICASVQCQVFSGATVLESLGGALWARAVRDTAGRAVLYRGRPILARYHSVSGGATLANPEAFPDEPAYPYLRQVPSPHESASPLWRWRARFTLARLQRILERAGWWGTDQGRLQRVATVASSDGLHYPDVVLSGTAGSITRSAEEMRDMLRMTAPEVYPRRYPSHAPLASGRLPETWPSNRITITTRGRSVRVVGRGWGHGVGMSQWGAHGLARLGRSHEDILEHYYSGATVGSVPASRIIDVGLDWARSSVTVFGSFKLVDGGGRTVVPDALGTWTLRHAGSGAIGVDPPEGFGLPLQIGIVRRRGSVTPGQAVAITVVLSRPARVGVGGERAELIEAGRRQLTWRAPEVPGRYRIRVRASTGSRRRRDSIVVEVAGLRVKPEATDRDSNGGGSALGWALGIVILFSVLGAATIVRIRPWAQR